MPLSKLVSMLVNRYSMVEFPVSNSEFPYKFRHRLPFLTGFCRLSLSMLVSKLVNRGLTLEFPVSSFECRYEHREHRHHETMFSFLNSFDVVEAGGSSFLSSFLLQASGFDTSIATDKRNFYNETGFVALTLTFLTNYLFAYRYHRMMLSP